MSSLDKKYFQRLIESSPDIIIAVDKSGTVNYYNDGARTSLGYSPDEMIGQNVTGVYPSLDEARSVMRAMRDSADKGRIAGFETKFRNKDGEIIPVMITGALIHDDDGSEIGSIGFARDIRRMRHAQQLATAGEIAVSLAHEINNPLESITNNVELLSQCLESRLSESEKVVENERLDSIRNSLERVQAIVRRLDEMTRKGEYETRDYLAGKRMADLAPRDDGRDVGAGARRRYRRGKFDGRPVARREMRRVLRDASVGRIWNSAQRQARCDNLRRRDARDGRLRLLSQGQGRHAEAAGHPDDR